MRSNSEPRPVNLQRGGGVLGSDPAARATDPDTDG